MEKNVSAQERNVSASVIKRLPRYYRYLGELISCGIERISSKELSRRMGVTASQIRQDLNCFGGFGQQGYGYNVEYLYGEISAILGLNHGYAAILVGAGNIGRAFAVNTNFEKRGFRLIGIFDTDPEKIGMEVGDLTISDYGNIKNFISKNKPIMAILAVPRTVVNQVAHELIDCGIRAFMNFSYAEISADESIAVENVHLSDSLMRLCYKISANEKNKTSEK